MSILDDLRRDGIWAPVDAMLGADLSRIVRHISIRPVYNGHVWAHSDRIGRALSSGMETCCSTQETVLAAPGFLAFVDQFTPLARAYLEEPALLYSVNAFWTAPGPAQPHPYYQQFHRDQDDRKFLAMFIYGTPVMTEIDGPHLYDVGSHLRRELDEPKHPRAIYGAPGTAFLADTSGLHMGMKPSRGRRLIFWARWGVSEPPASYIGDHLVPVDRAKVPYPYAEHLRLVMR